MRGGRGRDERRAVAARRLARLGDELAVLREPVVGDGTEHTHTRVRPAEDLSAGFGWGDADEGWEPAPVPGASVPTVDPAAGVPGPVAVPVPGRHAARRLRPLPVVGLLGPAQLTVLAVLVAVGLAVTCWWLLRSSPEVVPVSAEAAPALVTPMAEGAAEVPADTGDPSELVVDVAGKVRHPGIAVLEPGARVIDALRAAGGARRGVDLSSLNLARPLVDGEQILVGVGGGPQPAPASGAPGAGLLVNINTAGQAELESLPEVGPVTAAAIIAWREQHGGFGSIDQLVEVDGIGEATLATVTPFVTV